MPRVNVPPTSSKQIHETTSLYRWGLRHLRRLWHTQDPGTPWPELPSWEHTKAQEEAEDADEISLRQLSHARSLRDLCRERGVEAQARRHQGICRFRLAGTPVIYAEDRRFRASEQLQPLTYESLLLLLKSRDYAAAEGVDQQATTSKMTREVLEAELLHNAKLRPFLLHLQRALRRIWREDVALEDLLLYCILDAVCRLEGVMGLHQQTFAESLWEQPEQWSSYRAVMRAKMLDDADQTPPLDEAQWGELFASTLSNNMAHLHAAPPSNLLQQWFEQYGGCFPKSFNRYQAFVCLKPKANQEIARRCYEFCTSDLIAELVHGLCQLLPQIESQSLLKDAVRAELRKLLKASNSGEKAGLEQLTFTRDLVLEGIRRAPLWDNQTYIVTKAHAVELCGHTLWLPEGAVVLMPWDQHSMLSGLLPAPTEFSLANIRTLREYVGAGAGRDDSEQILAAMGAKDPASLALNVTLQVALLALVYAPGPR